MKVKTVNVNTNYAVTDCGRVFNLSRGNELKPFLTPKGYHLVRLGSKDTYSLHQLVAKAFIHNPQPDIFKQVNHLDGDKTYNDAYNLEWCTQSMNIRHAYETGLIKPLKGEGKANHKLTETNVIYACELYEKSFSPSDVARLLGDTELRHALYRVKSRQNWTHISDKYRF